MSRVKGLGILLLIMGLLISGCSGKNADGSTTKKERIAIASGGSGGVFFILSAGIGDILNNNSKKMQVSTETTAATAENLKLVNSKEVQFGFTVFDAGVDAYNGNAPYKKHENLRLVMRGHSGYIHIYAKKDSPISSIADFKGKKVSMAPGDIGKLLLGSSVEPYGLTLKDFKGSPLSMTDSNSGLMDNNVDVGFQMMGLPGSSIMDISNQVDIKIIPYGEKEIEQIIQKRPAWSKGIIPANTYKGQTQAITTLKVPYAIVVNKDVSDEIVYEFIKVVMENTAKLKAIHVEGSAYGKDNDLFKAPTPLPYHPGAAKYLKEQGLIK